MKRRALALLLVFTLLMSSTAISAVAAGGTGPVTIGATTNKTITIQQRDIPPDPDVNVSGALTITTSNYSIDRDYDQVVVVTVTNNTSQPIVYYLTVDNDYDDLATDFLGGGSRLTPMVIQPGETQNVNLVLYAQNATRENFRLPLQAYVVQGGTAIADATATAKVDCEPVEVNFSCTTTATSATTLAKTMTLKNIGKYVADVTVSFAGGLESYIFTNPAISLYPMNTNDSVIFLASPDLTLMKADGVTRISGQLVVSAGGKTQSFDLVFDTEGKPINSMTIHDLALIQSGIDPQSITTQSTCTWCGALTVNHMTRQCTNRGSVTTDVEKPPWIDNPGNPDRPGRVGPQAAEDELRWFITSRMQGEGYSEGYVNTQLQTNTYKLNGVTIGTSTGATLTEVAVVELPTANLYSDQKNTLVRTWDTNAGSNSITTDTEMTFLYPHDTQVSFIGSAEDMPDVRLKADYAVYPENIYIDNESVVVGSPTALRVNYYNRSSADGLCDITVYDGATVVYSEQNVAMPAFSMKTASFSWTPSSESREIKVELTAKGTVPETKTDNNVAVKTIAVKGAYEVPVIEALDPTTLELQDGSTISATVSQYEHITDVKFYVDNVLCSGTLESGRLGTEMRYWVDAPISLTDGSHELKVVVTYANGAATTDTVEKTATTTVTSKRGILVTLDAAFTNPTFFVRQIDGSAYPPSASADQISATEYQLVVNKAILTNPGNYALLVVADNAVLWSKLDVSDINFAPSTCKTLTWQTPAGMTLEDVDLRKFGDYTAYLGLPTVTPLYVTPAAYRFDITYRYNGVWGSTTVDVDLSAANQTVDLSSQMKAYQFTLPASVTYASATLYYKSGSDWRSAYLNNSYNSVTNTLSALLTSPGTLTGASDAIIVVRSDDTIWTTAESVAAAGPVTLSTAGLRKVTINMEDPATMDFNSVMVRTDAFSSYLYTDEIYMPAGNYQIIVSCLLDQTTYMQQAFDVDLTTGDKTITVTKGSGTNLSITWGNAYADTADTYGYGVKSSLFAVADYEKGTPIIVTPDTYAVITELTHGDSSYRVISQDVVVGTAAKTLTVGDIFTGTLSGFNDKITYPGATTITLDIDDLVDENGNLLYDFSSNTQVDSLKGYVLFTNVNDPTDRYIVPITISDYDGSITVELPNATGTFNISFRASTDGVDPEDPQDPRDPCGKVWKKVLKIVAWVLGIFGVAATAAIVIKAATWFYGIILALIGIPVIGVILWLIF